MPTTGGNGVRTVADIVQVLTQCTKQEADIAELQMCKSPKALATLALACGVSTSAISMGGRLAVAGISTGGSVSIGGLVLAGAGLMGAKKFCTGFVSNAAQSIKGAAASGGE